LPLSEKDLKWAKEVAEKWCSTDIKKTEEDIKEIMRRFHFSREDAEKAPLTVLLVPEKPLPLTENERKYGEELGKKLAAKQIKEK